MTERKRLTLPAKLVIHGGPFGGIPLPKNALITTDADLLDHAINRGNVPPSVKDPAHLLVIQLGYAQVSNPMLSGLIWEIVLARRDAYRAGTWLLINEDPVLDPHFALDARTRRMIANWQHTHLYGDGELRCTLPTARLADEMDEVDAALLDQIAEATEEVADYREMAGQFADEDESSEGEQDFSDDDEDDEEEDDDGEESDDDEDVQEAV